MSTGVSSSPIMVIGVNDMIKSEPAMPNAHQFMYIGPFQWQEVEELTVTQGDMPGCMSSAAPPGPGHQATICD